jgi:hypothetical protein
LFVNDELLDVDSSRTKGPLGATRYRKGATVTS